MDNITKALIDYCKLNDVCRGNFLFADFESYVSGSAFGCNCCDVCAKSCDCGMCTEILS